MAQMQVIRHHWVLQNDFFFPVDVFLHTSALKISQWDMITDIWHFFSIWGKAMPSNSRSMKAYRHV